MVVPCWFTLWTSGRFLHHYILLISIEIFLIFLYDMDTARFISMKNCKNCYDKLFECVREKYTLEKPVKVKFHSAKATRSRHGTTSAEALPSFCHLLDKCMAWLS